MAARSTLAWMKADTIRTLPGVLARWLAWVLDHLALAALAATIFFMGYWRPLNIMLFPQFPASAEYYPLITIYASDISTLVTVALWLIARIFAALTRQARAPLRLGPPYLTLPLFALSALSTLSAAQAIAPSLSFEIAIHLFVLTIFILAVMNLRPPAWVIIMPLALLLAIEGVVSLLQVQAQSTLFASFLFGWNLNATASRPGASVVQLSDGVRWLRGYGTFPHPNILGGFLCLALPLVAGSYLRLPWRSLRAWVLLAALTLGLLALLLSFSRAAWLGVLAGTLWVFWQFWLRHRAARSAARDGGAAIRQHSDWRYKTSRAWVRPVLVGLLGVALMVGLVASLGPVLQSRLLLDHSTLEQRSVDERLVLLQASAFFLSKYPWLGVGAGNMPLAELSYPPTTDVEQPVHNVTVLVGVETGIFGLFLWLIGPLGVLWVAWRRRLHLSLAGLAASTALVALLAPAQLDHYLWSSTTGRLMFWLALTLAALWCRQENIEAQKA